MNLIQLSEAEYAILRHCEATGAWMTDCDPVDLDRAAADKLVENRMLDFDGTSYTLTTAAKRLLRWGSA